MKKLLLVLLLLIPWPSFAAIAVIGTPSNSNCAGSSDNITVSVVLNTTGMNFAYALVSDYTSAMHTSMVAPASGWTELGNTANMSSSSRSTLWYLPNATGSSSETFTATSDSGSSYPSLCVIPFSGIDPAAALQVGSDEGAGAVSISTPITLGSETAAGDGYLYVSGGAFLGATSMLTVDSGLSTPITVASSGNHFGCATAYLIQMTAAPVAPSWSWTGSGDFAARMAIFKPDSGGGGDNLAGRLTTLGAGR